MIYLKKNQILLLFLITCLSLPPLVMKARSVPVALDTLIRYLRVEVNDHSHYYCLEYTVEQGRPAYPRQLLTFEAIPGAMPLPADFREVVSESFVTFWGANTKALERDTLTPADFEHRIEKRDYNADGRTDLGFKSWASGNNAVYHIFLNQLDHWMHWPRAPQPILRVDEKQRTLSTGHSASAVEFYKALYRVSGDTVLTKLFEEEVARHTDGRLVRTRREHIDGRWITKIDSNYIHN